MIADWFGDRAVLVILDDDGQREAWRAALSTQFPECIVRAGKSSVLVEASMPTSTLLEAVRARVADLDRSTRGDFTAAPSDTRSPVVIRVAYDGEDLVSVAEALGSSAAALVKAHQQQPWLVAMMGFAPGFGYLVPDGPSLLNWSEIARRDRPREQVPAGSVALAAGMTAVYPEGLPGGWHLIGRTDTRMFDPAAADPTLLHPGDRVRFAAEAP